jgi:hypothetical protein
MARVQATDEVWADFRALAGYRPIAQVLGELVEREVDRYRSRRLKDNELEPRELLDALDRAQRQLEALDDDREILPGPRLHRRPRCRRCARAGGERIRRSEPRPGFPLSRPHPRRGERGGKVLHAPGDYDPAAQFCGGVLRCPKGGTRRRWSGAAWAGGEDAVRGAYDIGRKIKVDVAGRKRIPDGLTPTTVSEVKNVGSLSYSQQLRDLAQYAQQTGRSFDLYVRPTTRLSGPLQRASGRGGPINLRFIP